MRNAQSECGQAYDRWVSALAVEVCVEGSTGTARVEVMHGARVEDIHRVLCCRSVVVHYIIEFR